MSPPANRVQVAPASKAGCRPPRAAWRSAASRRGRSRGRCRTASCRPTPARAPPGRPHRRAGTRGACGSSRDPWSGPWPRRPRRAATRRTAGRPRGRRGSRPSRPPRARARRSACWSRRARRRPPCAWCPVAVVRYWVTGTIATAPGGPGVAAGGDAEALGDAASEGVAVAPGEGSAPVDDAGVAVGPPPAALGDGLAPPKPISPPVMGSTMAMARRPRTSRSGPRFTARMLPADRRTPRPGGRTGRREMR